MRIEINNPLLWKLLAIIGVSVFIVCATGCKNGKRLNTGSSAVVRVITPNSLVRQPDGTYRIKSENVGIPPGNPVPHEPPKIKSVPIKSVKTPPKIELKSAEANPVKNEAKAAGSKTKFSPSITDASKTRMNVVKNDKADVKNTDSVKGGDSNLKGKNGKIAAPREAGSKKSSGVTIKYGELILFYLLGFLIMAFAYIIYDIYKTKKEKIPAPKKSRKRSKKPTKPKRS